MGAMGAMGAMGGGYRVVPAAPSGGATTSLEVPCQGNEGRVIGKGGDMIKYIQNATGCKLDMKRDVGTVLVTGPPEGVAQAEALIREVIENGDTRDKGGLVPGARVQVQPNAAAAAGYVSATAPPGAMMMAVPVQQGYVVQQPAYVPAQGGYVQAHATYAPAQGGYPYDPAGATQYGHHAPQGGYGHPGAQQGQPYVPDVAAQGSAWGQQHAVAPAWGQQQQQQQQQQVPGLTTQTPQAQAQQGEWQTHYSEGRAYYYNPATGETQWA